ncbi:hypothetical protein HZS_2949, partial [Henneguya salminicola]
MKISPNNIDSYDSDGDYNKLKDQCKKLKTERNKLILQIQQKDNVSIIKLLKELNEEKNKKYIQKLENIDDSQHQLEIYKLELENKMKGKINEIQMNYEDKIKSLGNKYQNEIERINNAKSLENNSLKEQIDINGKFSAIIEDLKIQITNLENDKNKIEKQNILYEDAKVLIFLDIKLILKEKCRVNFELQEQVASLSEENDELNKKVQSYKFLISEKESYISSILEENKIMSEKYYQKDIVIYFDKIQTISENTRNLEHKFNEDIDKLFTERLEIAEIIQNLVNKYEGLVTSISSFKVNEHFSNYLEKQHQDIKKWLKNINGMLFNICCDDGGVNRLKSNDETEAKINYHSLTLMIENSIKTICTKMSKYEEIVSATELLTQEISISKRKIHASSEVIDEQSILIGHLVKEIKRIKSAFKNTFLDIKKDFYDEKQLRLLQATKNQSVIRDLEIKISEYEKYMRKFKEKYSIIKKENENLSNQLKFLVKQKILLSQQIEEYECHIMQNFNNAVYADE